MLKKFINGIGCILIDLGKISFGGIVISSIMDSKNGDLSFIIIGSIVSTGAFILGLILKITTEKS